jgi:hypothetical protein
VPVDQVAGVGSGPVAVFGNAGISTLTQKIPLALIGGAHAPDGFDALVGVFGVAKGMMRSAPFDVQKVIDLFHLLATDVLVLGENPPVPACPDGG